MTIFTRPGGRAERRLRAGTGLATLCLLAACGGGGDDGVTRAPTTPVTPVDTTYNIPAGEVRTLSDPDGTGTAIQDAGFVLEDGRSLTARSVGSAAVTLGYGDGGTSIAPGTVVEVRRNAAGELTLVVDGVQYDFDAGDREVDGFGYFTEDECDSSGVCVGAFIYEADGGIDELLTTRNGWAEVIGYQTNQVPTSPDGRDLAGFAIVGTETRNDVLAGLPTATYTGRARVNVYPETGFVNNSTSRTVQQGDLSMTANFGEGTIDGTIDNIQRRPAGSDTFDPVTGSLVMEKTQFDVNGFSGNVAAGPGYVSESPELLANTDYSGAFYGPEADQVAGTISGSGNGANAVGYFNGFKD